MHDLCFAAPLRRENRIIPSNCEGPPPPAALAHNFIYSGEVCWARKAPFRIHTRSHLGAAKCIYDLPLWAPEQQHRSGRESSVRPTPHGRDTTVYVCESPHLRWWRGKVLHEATIKNNNSFYGVWAVLGRVFKTSKHLDNTVLNHKTLGYLLKHTWFAYLIGNMFPSSSISVLPERGIPPLLLFHFFLC